MNPDIIMLTHRDLGLVSLIANNITNRDLIARAQLTEWDVRFIRFALP
jgi:hypothetical protein